MSETATDTGTYVTYNDDDLVYVDPDARTVVGKVEFNEKGIAKKLERPAREIETDDDESDAKIDPASSNSAEASPKSNAKPDTSKPVRGKDRRPMRKPRTRYYPWGTYKTMKKIYKIEGKIPEPERTLTLDDVMEKAVQEPYWD